MLNVGETPREQEVAGGKLTLQRPHLGSRPCFSHVRSTGASPFRGSTPNDSESCVCARTIWTLSNRRHPRRSSPCHTAPGTKKSALHAARGGKVEKDRTVRIDSMVTETHIRKPTANCPATAYGCSPSFWFMRATSWGRRPSRSTTIAGRRSNGRSERRGGAGSVVRRRIASWWG